MNTEYIIVNGELYHYGVPGMRWGHRKVQRFSNKARIARDSAKEWEEMAKYAEAKGKMKKAAKYRANAKQDLKDADGLDRRANSEAKSKAKIARDSAKEWEEMAKYAAQKGKMNKAAKYAENAKQDLKDADSLEKLIKNAPKKAAKGKNSVSKSLTKTGNEKVSAVKKKNKRKVQTGEKKSMSAIGIVGANLLRSYEIRMIDKDPYGMTALKLANYFSK